METTNNSFKDALIDMNNIKSEISKQVEQKIIKENAKKINDLTKQLFENEWKKDDDNAFQSNYNSKEDLEKIGGDIEELHETEETNTDTTNGVTVDKLDDFITNFFSGDDLTKILDRPDVDSVEIEVTDDNNDNATTKTNDTKNNSQEKPMNVDNYKKEDGQDLSEEEMQNALKEIFSEVGEDDNTDQTPETPIDEMEITSTDETGELGDDVESLVLAYLSKELGITSDDDDTSEDVSIAQTTPIISTIGDTEDTGNDETIGATGEDTDDLGDINTNEPVEDEDAIEEGTSVSHKNLRSVATGSKEHSQKYQEHVPKEEIRGPKGLNEAYQNEIKVIKEKVSQLINENKKLKDSKAKLEELNTKAAERLNEIKNKLYEATVSHNNATYVNRLFLEHTVTKGDQQRILESFLGIETLEESKNAYALFAKELSEKPIISESANATVIKTINSDTATLVEHTITNVPATNPYLEKFNELINHGNKKK